MDTRDFGHLILPLSSFACNTPKCDVYLQRLSKMSEPVNDATAAETARLQAEARRMRILETATRRMDVVSGDLAMEEEEKAASEAKTARIRAARQRRYGKKSAAPKESSEEAGGNNDDIDENSAGNPTAKSEPDTVVETPTESKPAPESESEKPVWPEDEEYKSGSASTGEGSKKKYLGVARMRRNALKIKKGAADETPDSGSAPVVIEEYDVKSIAINPIKSSRLPIYMHIITILLLFLAGLDVALQQYNPTVDVEASLSIVQNGFPAAHRSIGSVAAKKKSSLWESQSELMVIQDVQEEFEEGEEKLVNLDPVFGVDLDGLTKGPGLMKQLARGAVGFHRSILYLVYHLPWTVLQSFAGIPRALLRSPPALCLVALVVRHGVGKTVLGAGLPSIQTENYKGIDVLAMAKNFVFSFLATNFPTAVTIYDAFTHLRSDMYVVLCGVFTGLVSVHMMGTVSQLADVEYETGSDEL